MPASASASKDNLKGSKGEYKSKFLLHAVAIIFFLPLLRTTIELPPAVFSILLHFEERDVFLHPCSLYPFSLTSVPNCSTPSPPPHDQLPPSPIILANPPDIKVDTKGKSDHKHKVDDKSKPKGDDKKGPKDDKHAHPHAQDDDLI
jgi:hypothetical protein